MAIITAIKTGNFNDPTVWDSGTVPGVGDTAKPASYTITITADVTCDLLNGTGQNGYFRVLTSGITINANAQAGMTNVNFLRFNHTSGECTVNGTVTGGAANNAACVYNASSGTVNVTTAIGGSGIASHGVNNASGGTVNVTTAIGGGGSSYAIGAHNAATGTVNVTTAIGGGGSGAYGIYNAGAGTVNVTTAIGGGGSYASGAHNAATGTVNVTTAIGGSGITSHGVNNASGGTVNVTTAIGGSGLTAYGAHNAGAGGKMYVERAIGNDYGYGGTMNNPVPGVFGKNAVAIITTVEKIESGAYGQAAIAGAVLLLDKPTDYAQFRLTQGGSTKTLVTAETAGDYPAEADVRADVAYKFNESIGTCVVPAPESVAYGIPVDDTVGMALLRPEDAAEAVWEHSERTLTEMSEVLLGSIWDWPTRTLTQTVAQIESILKGNNDITALRGDYWHITLTGLGGLVGREKLYFTVKSHKSLPDSAAVIQIEETDGLLYLNGATATKTDGLLTVNDEDAGVITVVLKSAATAELLPGTYYYDMQVVNDTGAFTLTEGRLTVNDDVTRAIN